ncbi:MAG: DNA-binding protein [Clostridia bacterium]|nr:DNA-binding protein [Clostridia bacterium]
MKDLGFIELYEVYKELFTANQRRLLDGYYDYDLTLSELAEESGTTRQSVYDAVRKAKVILNEYENKLGLIKKKKKLEEFSETLPEDKKNELKNILS